MNGPRLVLAVVLTAGALGAPAVGRAASAAPAAPAASMTLGSESRLWLEGDSTLHTFQSTATIVNVASTLSGGDLASTVRSQGVQKLALTIPLEGLKSGEKGLDKNMMKAMKADEHPTITFGLESYELPSCDAKAPACPVKAKGKLQISGVEKEIDLAADLVFQPDGLRLKGSQELLMSDYGIKPPTMMLGAIKVKDKIVVKYDLKLQAQGGAP